MKPDDWDDEMDGEWEPATINNPDYKVWKARVLFKSVNALSLPSLLAAASWIQSHQVAVVSYFIFVSFCRANGNPSRSTTLITKASGSTR